jgi:poly-gamma-glutamate capsule biosynthesis protein CapA/YwtB (metallophosphatase superfamily)
MRLPRTTSTASSVQARRVLLLSTLIASLVACGTPIPTSSSAPSGFSQTPSPSATPLRTPTPAPTPSASPAPTLFPIAVVVRFDDGRASITPEALAASATSGQLLVPCEVTALTLSGAPIPIPASTACQTAAQILTTIHAKAGIIGLLPPGLVSPSVKVLQIGQADLFGSPTHRAVPYPLIARTDAPASWTAYNVGDVRTLISTGDTCPDRGVSMLAVTQHKGWDWTLAGGSAHYTAMHMDTQFSGPAGKGWPVPTIRRNGAAGAVAALIADNDVSANDFECPMFAGWKQHNNGTVFSIDPRVAQLLATKGGLKVVTLGSNHITDGGTSGVLQTIKYLDAAGIKHTGAGANLAAALAPAVVDVRGVRFAFVGWDDIHGSAAANATRPGVAPMTDTNVCNSIKAARLVADVVIAMPQWGWPEYHNTITKDQVRQRALFYQCGADDVLGSGTHWASWASILPGPNGPQFAIGSHGNFLFDQNWSQQTMEGVVVEATFVGTRLVQFRLHPYVVVQEAQPNLLDPLGDGKTVLARVWSVSDVR